AVAAEGYVCSSNTSGCNKSSRSEENFFHSFSLGLSIHLPRPENPEWVCISLSLFWGAVGKHPA
ncbi:hypothetical protein, partial [Shimia litoralis]|uniref:hypothetical protein n=1 Tax=Shimia litoralis TaxID=420403 RepID=UPI001BB18E89